MFGKEVKSTKFILTYILCIEINSSTDKIQNHAQFDPVFCITCSMIGNFVKFELTFDVL